MGCYMSKRKNKGKACRNRVLRERIKLLQGEIDEVRSKREKEIQVYEQQVKVHEMKEAWWNKEKKSLKKEVKRLKMKLEEKEKEIIRGLMEYEIGHVGDWLQGEKFLIGYMREEQLRREEAVDKWKRLYLAIKTELDHLIDRTCQGESVCLKPEDKMMEDFHREMKAKEETIQILKTRLIAMEEAASKRTTEFDILRQSQRIINHAREGYSVAAL